MTRAEQQKKDQRYRDWRTVYEQEKQRVKQWGQRHTSGKGTNKPLTVERAVTMPGR